jgi:hypothetical protein
MDSATQEQMLEIIRRLNRAGWPPSAVAEYIALTEEYNPNLPEEYALVRMAQVIKDNVPVSD